mgnify:CR=1 FL=1
MINVVFELAFVDDMIDFFSNTLNSSIPANLSNDELIVLRLSEFQTLIYTLCTISNDIFKFKWSKLSPFFLNSSQCNSRILSFFLSSTVSTAVDRLVMIEFVLTFEFNSTSLVVSWVECLLWRSISHVQVWCSGWRSCSHWLSFWASGIS